MTLKEFFDKLRAMFVDVDVDALDTDEKDKGIEEKEAVKVDDTEDKSEVEDKEDKIEEVKEDEEIKKDEEVKVDEEVKTDSETVEDKKEDEEDKKEDEEVKTEDVNLDSEDKKDDSEILEDGWFDIDTETVDFNKIHNDEVKAKIKAFSDSMKIKAAVDEALKAENLAVSIPTAKKLMDLSDVVVEEGKVSGIDTAIQQLKKTEPGLFKKESNSLNEPFNPLNKSIDMNPKSFADALRLMDEV